MVKVIGMQKKFNVNGVCYPDRHYMVDLNGRLKKIRRLVDNGDYFVINRARQYGKTTILRALKDFLQQDYIVIFMSFQKMSSAKFKDEASFARAFARDFIKKAAADTENGRMDEASILELEERCRDDFDLVEMFEMLSSICASASERIVLMIDEVDQVSNHQVFLDFLGQMREYYMNREETMTFHSVILAGVYDIKNLRLKIRPDEVHRYNSPWNITADFDVDMSFSPEDIVTMLRTYEADHHTGMNIGRMAEELYGYTGGYPYLISCLCRKIDEKCMGWDTADLRMAVRDLLKERNTLFEDVIKNIRSNQEFSNLAEQLLLNGANVVFERSNPIIDLGEMFGILAEKDGKAAISNVIFETLILNYFTSVRATKALINSEYIEKSRYIREGRLDMEKVIRKFAVFLKSEYRREDGAFIEQQGRLLFLGFLRPIINGTGHYAVEPQTRKNARMDIQIFYGNEEFIVELKCWRGEAYERKGYDQLAEYLEARGQQQGYLISFSRNKKKPKEDQWIRHKGHDIFEVIVEC